MRRGPLVLLVRRIGFTKPSIAESAGAGNVIPVRASARLSPVLPMSVLTHKPLRLLNAPTVRARSSTNLRFAVVVILLAGVGWFLRSWNHSEIIPARENFSSFPRQLGEWAGVDSNIPQDVRALLGPGDFLLRSYRPSSADNPSVDLFLAYFPSQRIGDTIHSPKHCLPGSGWLPVESTEVTLSLPEQTPFLVNRYVMAKGTQRALAMYWYWAHNRAVTSEYWAKFYLIADSIRRNRSDGSLIRVTTELKNGETAAEAQSRLVSVLNGLTPVLYRYIPR